MYPAFIERISSTSSILWPILLDSLARGLVILLAAALATLLMRRASAAARHLVWFLATLSLLLLPVLSAALPAWHALPRVAHFDAPPRSAAAPSAIAPVATPVPIDLGSPPAVVKQPDAVPAAVADAPEAALSQPSAALTAAPPVEVQPVFAPAPPPALPPRLGIQAWLVLAWLAGVVILLARILGGLLSLRWLERNSAHVTQGPIAGLLADLSGRLGVRWPVELLSSPRRAMPMTWGLLRTRLLLPEQATTWPPEQRRAVLLHELAHARRRDCLTQILAQIACALYWFNPLVWVAWRRMQAEQERACDDLVLNTGHSASAYAEHLLHSASAMPAVRWHATAIAMARPSTLEERLRAILDPHRNRRAMTAWSALGAILLLAAALVPVAALKAQNAPASNALSVAAPAATPATTQPAARLQLRPVLSDGEPGAFDEMADPGNPGRSLRIGRELVLGESEIAASSVSFDADGSRTLVLRLYPVGAQTMQRWTEANSGRRLAIVLDGKIAFASAPQDRATRLGNELALSITGPDQQATQALLDYFSRSTNAAALRAAGAAAPASRPSRGAPPGYTGTGPARGMAPMTLGEGPTCGLDGTIYELRVAREQIGRLDMAKLTQAAADPAAFEKALADLGTAKPLYRVNQTVRLASDTINIGAQTPYVANSNINSTGVVTNSVQYATVGATFGIAGQAGAAGRIDADLRISVSAMEESGVTVGKNLKVPIMRSVTLVHKGLVDAGQPFVAMSVDASSLDSAGKAVGYVARITLGPVQTTTRPGTR